MKTEELIYFGTKAPSGHNSQPWKFKMQESKIEIHPDFRFALPVVDPNHRELYISLGCAAENIRVAAIYHNLKAKWSLLKNPDEAYYVNINLDKTEAHHNEDVLKIIEKRQTNRKVYNGKMITDDVIDTLNQIELENHIKCYYFKKGTDEFNTIKGFIREGNEIQMNDSYFKNELLSWIRFNKKQIRKSNNGLTYEVMGAPQMPNLIGKMIMKSYFNPRKQNKSDEEKIDSSSHFVLLTSKNNSIDEWVSLGFYLERLLLKFTELGIANAYLNPPCEIHLLAEDLRKQLPINKEFPTIIMRIGFAETTSYSPRKAIKEVIYEE